MTAVQKAGRLDRKGRLDLSFDQITINGRNYPIRGTIVEALESGGYREDAEKIGAGAAVAATEGEDVELRPGTILRMRLDQALNVRL